MERWEHLFMHFSVDQINGDKALYLVGGPDYVRQDIELDPSVAGDAGLRHLDLFGRDGWQLVATESEEADNQVVRRYWLKRQAQPEESPVESVIEYD